MQQGARHVQTREVSFSSSILSNPAASESSPLLTSRLHSVSSSKSFSGGTVSEYRFDWKKERLRCRKMFYNRIPKGKAAFVAFLLNFLESFAFYGALNLIHFTVFENHGHYKRSPNTDFLFTIMFFTAGRVFYPVAGLIADVYLGRYRVIHIGLWLFLVGYVIILMSMALQWQYVHLSILQKVPAIIATILFMLGSASVESPIIPYGVDQIRQGAPSDELSSYFFWYYFGRNGGFSFNIACSYIVVSLIKVSNRAIGISEFTNTTIPSIRNMEHTINYSILAIIALVGIIAALLLHYCFQDWFFKARRRENPLKSILNIVYFAATVRRQAPQYRRSFRYGEGRKSRMELAKVEFDGIYSSEEVEDVKTFFRVLFLVLSLGFPFIAYGALSSMFSYITAHGVGNAYSFVDDGVILLFIPFLNHVILPCVPGASMKRRIGVGVFFLLLSTAMATIVQWQLHHIHSHHMRLFWQFMPIVLFAVAEALIFISGLEFIYAQSPDSMKGLLIGLFYFIFGAFNAVGTTIFKYLEPKIMWFYGAVLIICVLGLLVYILVVICYRNRERPTNDESEKDILHRSFATSVYLS